ncbi:MAG: fibronectin type III domain-containing protein [Lachnospiraceae bacterium]|nr:fibronectin type III domain-containing protein [Lachnospiraceae bacterium]
MKKRFLCVMLTTMLCASCIVPVAAEEIQADGEVQVSAEAAEDVSEEAAVQAVEEEVTAEGEGEQFYPANGALPAQIAYGKDTRFVMKATPGANFGYLISDATGSRQTVRMNGFANASAGETMTSINVEVYASDTAKYPIGAYKLEYWVNDNPHSVHNFTINRSVSSAENTDITRTLDEKSVVYTGAELTPKFTVTDKVNGAVKVLTEGIDYQMSVVSENKSAIGTATVRFTGIGDYMGTEDVNYEIKPSAPAGVTVTSLSAKVNRITWKKVPEASGYVVERKAATGTFTKVGETDAATLSFDDQSDLSVGEVSYYRVLAFAPNAANTALRTYSAADETGVSIISTCGAPTIKSFSAINTKSLKLTWDEVAGAAGYNLYIKGSDGKLTLKKKNIKKTSVVVKKLKCGTKYKFVLKAFAKTSDGKKIESAPSAVYKTYSRPATVQGVAVEEVSGTTVKVTWKKLSDVTGYIVYRKETKGDDDAWKKVGTVTGASNIVYYDQSASAGVKYSYTVAAYKKVKKKSYKGSMNAKGVKIQTVCLGPEIKTEQRHENSANVYIKNVAGASGYYLYRKAGTGEYALVATVEVQAGDTTTVRDTQVTKGTTYTYVAIAFSNVNGTPVKGVTGKEAKLVMK